MDTDSKYNGKFNNPEFFKKLLNYNDFSARRWKHLTEKQKKSFREYTLMPDELNHILKIFHLLKKEGKSESPSFAVNIGKLTYELFNEWLKCYHEEGKGKLDKYLPEYIAIKELLFRGFVPLDKFKIKPQRSYVITHKLIKGKRYIHPYEMGHNYRMTIGGKNLPYLWDNFHKIGLPGYTQVIYPDMEHYPKL